MNDNRMLTANERVLFPLRELYGQYGYLPYKMNKFEEYDLYVKNKDFLISDGVITFTDTNGRLLALKPDVTLSIVKNSRDGADGVQKVYYDENVYRVSGNTHAFREILQAGIECIGDVDNYCLYEVLMLAAESLRRISDEWVLDISDIDILSEVLETLDLAPDVKTAVWHCVGEKNLHELRQLCEQSGVNDQQIALLQQLLTVGGTPAQVLPKLCDLLPASQALARLQTVLQAFEGSEWADRLRVDFSVVSDNRYYNGIVFKGFINGVPDRVLSGGQYDKLMKKMGRSSRAVGFAVYLDTLERLYDLQESDDTQAVLLYKDTDNIATIQAAVAQLTAQGLQVVAAKTLPTERRAGQVWTLNDNEVKRIENNA